MTISNLSTVPPASTQQSPQSLGWATFSLSIGQLSLKLLDPSIAWLIIQEAQSTQLRRRDGTQLRPGGSRTLRRCRGGESCTPLVGSTRNDKPSGPQKSPIRIPILLPVAVQSQDGLPNSQLWLPDLELWVVHPIEPRQLEGTGTYPFKVLAFPFQIFFQTAQPFGHGNSKKFQRIFPTQKNDVADPDSTSSWWLRTCKRSSNTSKRCRISAQRASMAKEPSPERREVYWLIGWSNIKCVQLLQYLCTYI